MLRSSATEAGLRYEEEGVFDRVGAAVRIGLTNLDPAQAEVKDFDLGAIADDATEAVILIDVQDVMPGHVAKVGLQPHGQLTRFRDILGEQVERLVPDLHLVLELIKAVERTADIFSQGLSADGLLKTLDGDTLPAIALEVGDTGHVLVLDAYRERVRIAFETSARGSIRAVTSHSRIAGDVLSLLHRTAAARRIIVARSEEGERDTENQDREQATNAHGLPRKVS
ncbi:hypothetical protein C0581_05255 [Candidatus Parcubacteria bacterium]|nr:MAG: hypothetical protein C0581_05255 [Candidatus Parcubacteria bacterium]